MGCTKAIVRELHERGFRFTPQREMVLQAMHEVEGHATADEIHRRVQQISSSVDISTVYRTLELLQELQVVASLELGGQRHYELLSLKGPHHHLLCRGCGKIVRVAQQSVLPLIEHLQEAYGFQAELDHLIIPGMCSSCVAESAPAGGDVTRNRGDS